MVTTTYSLEKIQATVHTIKKIDPQKRHRNETKNSMTPRKQRGPFWLAPEAASIQEKAEITPIIAKNTTSTAITAMITPKTLSSEIEPAALSKKNKRTIVPKIEMSQTPRG